MKTRQWVKLILGAGILASQAVGNKVTAQVPDWRGWIPSYGYFKTDLWIIIPIVIQWLLFFAGIVAVVFVIMGGYNYLTAGGDSEKAGAGRTTLVNAVIGLIIIFAAYALISFVMRQFVPSSGSPTPIP